MYACIEGDGAMLAVSLRPLPAAAHDHLALATAAHSSPSRVPSADAQSFLFRSYQFKRNVSAG